MGEYDFHSRCFCYFGMDNEIVVKNHYLRYNFLQIFLNNHLVLFPADYLVKQNCESTKVSTLSNKFFTSLSFTVSQKLLLRNIPRRKKIIRKNMKKKDFT